MRFSEVYGITIGKGDDWFDPLLTVDTELFIDPFLLYGFEMGNFVGSHDEVVALFNYAFKLVAQSKGDTSSAYWLRAERVLRFPEVSELCLGYTSLGIRGAGSGKGIAKRVAAALWKAVSLGIQEIKHFEEVQIFETQIGADRISDAVAKIIRHRLISYTVSVCSRHKVPVKAVRYGEGRFSPEEGRWLPLAVDLPVNPYSGTPVLLVPKQYLRSLPSINSDDFWDYCFSNENDTIRQQFGEDISSRVDKETIVKFATEYPTIEADYVRRKEATKDSRPYDFERDPEGKVKWYDASKQWVDGNPLALVVKDQKSFRKALEDMLSEFSRYVADNGGWRLLWNDNNTPRKEEAAQLLLLGVVSHYCKANDIDISKEVNIGRGPVDFKMAKGFSLRALLELKRADNTKFWSGLTKQLPKYMEAEQVKEGYFVIIVYREKDLEKIKGINERIAEMNKKLPYKITPIVIDAQRAPPSASLL